MKKYMAIIITIIVVIGVFTGCGKEQDDSIALCIGVQNTMGCCVPNLTETVMDDIETTTAFDGSNITVFEIDGHAYEVKNTKIEYEPGLSSSNKAELASDYAYETVNAMLKLAKPKTAEVDILYALTAMGNKLQSSKKDIKRLILVSNLLSTTGLINFTKSTIYFSIDNYISEYLKSELPDLEGIDVTFYIAETEEPQKSLNNSDITILKEFYTKVCATAGANSVEFIEDNTKYYVENEDVPNVSCVDIRTSEYKSETDDIDIVLEEAALFLPDSTEFVNESKTEKDLKEIINTINNSKGKTLIFGSTATTSSSAEGHLKFGLERAQRIYDKLVELGANKNKLEYFSLGKEAHPYRINDTGVFATEENHSKNRCVYIVSENTDKGSKLKETAQQYSVNH